MNEYSGHARSCTELEHQWPLSETDSIAEQDAADIRAVPGSHELQEGTYLASRTSAIAQCPALAIAARAHLQRCQVRRRELLLRSRSSGLVFRAICFSAVNVGAANTCIGHQVHPGVHQA